MSRVSASVRRASRLLVAAAAEAESASWLTGAAYFWSYLAVGAATASLALRQAGRELSAFTR